MTIADITALITTMTESITMMQSVVILSAVACVVSLWVMLRSYYNNRKVQQRLHRLEHDLRIAHSSAIGMGQQIISLEKQLKQQRQQSPQRVAKPKTAAVPPTSKPTPVAVDTTATVNGSVYDQARAGLANGDSIAAVAKRCGLSYAEVSLLQALGRQVAVSSA